MAGGAPIAMPIADSILAAIASPADASEDRLAVWVPVCGRRQLFIVECRRYPALLDRPVAEDGGRRATSACADSIVLRKTWGDAVHAIFRTATAAASAALEMQAATAQLSEDLERGRRLSFRIAVHYGAADSGFDPVEQAPSIFGPQLSFAARIVPVAPPGGIFVTEPFAAQLSLERARKFDCSYVGTTSLAKSYGRVRLLTLV